MNIYFSIILEMWTVYCVKTAILLNNSSVIQQRCMILPEMADAECRIQQTRARVILDEMRNAALES